MMITVSLSAEDYRELELLAQKRSDMDSETLIRCFVADLTRSQAGWSGGSDERDFANNWLDRRFGAEGYSF